MRKEAKKSRSGAIVNRIVDPDLDAAFDRACEELDAARSGGSKGELHRAARVLRAVIVSSEREGEERSWS